MLMQDLLVVMRTVLAAPVGMMDAALGWCAEGYGHVQSPDRKVTLHAIADCPADHTSGMQVQDHSQIQPALTRPDIADVARLSGGRRMFTFAESPFPVWRICGEIPIKQVWSDFKLVITVRRHLVFTGSHNGYAVLAHQSTDTTLSAIEGNRLSATDAQYPSQSLSALQSSVACRNCPGSDATAP